MKRKIHLTFFIAICASITMLSMVSYNTRSDSTQQGTVVAEYEWGGKHYITLEEIDQEISEMPVYRRDRYSKKENKEEYLKDKVEEKLQIHAARDASLDKEPEITEKVEEYLHQLMIEKLAEQEIDEQVQVLEDEMKQYYEEHKSEYVEPEKVRLICITVTDEQRAKEVFEKFRRAKILQRWLQNCPKCKRMSDQVETTTVIQISLTRIVTHGRNHSLMLSRSWKLVS
jgi:preprotein translocase subunit SecD